VTQRASPFNAPAVSGGGSRPGKLNIHVERNNFGRSVVGASPPPEVYVADMCVSTHRMDNCLNTHIAGPFLKRTRFRLNPISERLKPKKDR
jgi:hypothetical protein